MAKGPGVPDGGRFGERHALDIAPTILSLLGAPLPAHFEGEPITFERVEAPLSA